MHKCYYTQNVMKVLLVGNLCDDKWIGSLIRNLKRTAEIDFFHILTLNKQLSDASQFCKNVYTVQKHFPDFLYKIPKFCHLLSLLDVPLSLKKFLKESNKKKHYDVVNIHYPQNKVLCCWRDFKLVSKTIIITPWGSDVLRISKFSQRIMANYMTHYNYIMSSDNPRFRDQLQKILNIPDEKFLSCDFGSEMIDELCNSTITKSEAKKHFGIDSQYTIVCGYNGGMAQNHLKIIEAIAQVKSKLPQELVIVLPMTYNASSSYLRDVQKKMADNRLDSIILKNYLSNSDMVCLRKCADMFIHAQNTDANSVSLAEHLLCDTVVVNANWLRYANREFWGIPYYLFESFEDLPEVIVKAYNGGAIASKQLKRSISEEGWSVVIDRWINIFERKSN